jgi:outer membrane protein TolC
LSDTAPTQPLTQLLKIHQAEKMALSDQEIAAADLGKARTDVVFATPRLFFGLLIAPKQRYAASAAVAAGEEVVREAGDGVATRTVLALAAVGNSTAFLQNRYVLLAANTQTSASNSELNDLLGLPLDTEIDPFDPPHRRPLHDPANHSCARLVKRTRRLGLNHKQQRRPAMEPYRTQGSTRYNGQMIEQHMLVHNIVNQDLRPCDQIQEKMRLASDASRVGTATEAQYLTAVAAVSDAEYEQARALLGYNLAVADLERIIGSQANA